jgi:hypothetical protein
VRDGSSGVQFRSLTQISLDKSAVRIPIRVPAQMYGVTRCQAEGHPCCISTPQTPGRPLLPTPSDDVLLTEGGC